MVAEEEVILNIKNAPNAVSGWQQRNIFVAATTDVVAAMSMLQR